MLKNKEKYGKIQLFFFRRWVWITAGCKHIFLKHLKFSIHRCFCRPKSDNIKPVKKNKEKSGKIENIFFCRRVWLSVGCKHIFLKYLKLPIYLYFCGPDRVILSRLKKIKKNLEKSKVLFYGVGFTCRSKVVTFS